MKLRIIILTITCMTCIPVFSQTVYNSRFGSSIPPNTVEGSTIANYIRVLLVFAEVDYSACGESDPQNDSIWPAGSLPLDVSSNYFDLATDTQFPQARLSKYYNDISFGDHRVIGDHYPNIVTIPCTGLSTGDKQAPTQRVIDSINVLHTSPNASFLSANGYPIDSFDIWTEPGEGVQKIKQSNGDGKIDLLLVIWRNNLILSAGSCSAGAGVQRPDKLGFNFLNTAMAGKSGFNNVGSYTACASSDNAFGFTIAEYFHALYGGNNWHTGGGAAGYTFLTNVGSYSTTAQHGSSSRAVNGWDRFHLNWYHPDNNLDTITALDETFNLTITDLRVDAQDSIVLVLRDHFVTGDAIRIKLPHINWQQSGDVKNQYLWLENR